MVTQRSASTWSMVLTDSARIAIPPTTIHSLQCQHYHEKYQNYYKTTPQQERTATTTKTTQKYHTAWPLASAAFEHYRLAVKFKWKTPTPTTKTSKFFFKLLLIISRANNAMPNCRIAVINKCRNVKCENAESICSSYTHITQMQSTHPHIHTLGFCDVVKRLRVGDVVLMRQPVDLLQRQVCRVPTLVATASPTIGIVRRAHLRVHGRNCCCHGATASQCPQHSCLSCLTVLYNTCCD